METVWELEEGSETYGSMRGGIGKETARFEFDLDEGGYYYFACSLPYALNEQGTYRFERWKIQNSMWMRRFTAETSQSLFSVDVRLEVDSPFRRGLFKSFMVLDLSGEKEAYKCFEVPSSFTPAHVTVSLEGHSFTKKLKVVATCHRYGNAPTTSKEREIVARMGQYFVRQTMNVGKGDYQQIMQAERESLIKDTQLHDLMKDGEFRDQVLKAAIQNAPPSAAKTPPIPSSSSTSGSRSKPKVEGAIKKSKSKLRLPSKVKLLSRTRTNSDSAASTRSDPLLTAGRGSLLAVKNDPDNGSNNSLRRNSSRGTSGANTKGDDAGVMYEIESTTTIGDAMFYLLEQRVSSVPVWDELRRDYLGLFDIEDAMSFTLKLRAARRRRASSVLVSRTDPLSIHGVPLNSSETSHWFGLDLPVSVFFREHNRHLARWQPLTVSTPMIKVLAALTKDVKRIPVADPSTGRIIKVISQSEIIHQVFYRLLRSTTADSVKEYFDTTELNEDAVDRGITVYSLSDSVLNPFQRIMNNDEVDAVPIVDSRGRLVATIASVDAWFLCKLEMDENEPFDLNNLSVGDFLDHANTLSEMHLGKTRYEAVPIQVSTSLKASIAKIVQHKVHGVFVVDEAEKPIGRINVQNIIEAMARDAVQVFGRYENVANVFLWDKTSPDPRRPTVSETVRLAALRSAKTRASLTRHSPLVDNDLSQFPPPVPPPHSSIAGDGPPPQSLSGQTHEVRRSLSSASGKSGKSVLASVLSGNFGETNSNDANDILNHLIVHSMEEDAEQAKQRTRARSVDSVSQLSTTSQGSLDEHGNRKSSLSLASSPGPRIAPFTFDEPISTNTNEDGQTPLPSPPSYHTPTPTAAVAASHMDIALKRFAQETPDSVLPVDLQRQLEAALPPGLRTVGHWSRSFSLRRDGSSTLAILELLSKSCDPVVIAIQDQKGSVFGGFLPSGLYVDESMNINSFVEGPNGDGNSFVYTFGRPASKMDMLRIYRWTGANRFFRLLSSQGGFAMGGGNRGFAFYIDEALTLGTSQASATYANDCLASGETFECINLEIYTITTSLRASC